MGNPSPRYTSEFKAKAVELYLAAGPEIFECIECSCNRIRIHSAISLTHSECSVKEDKDKVESVKFRLQRRRVLVLE